MSGGLIIRLRPFEKFLINGVVLENGERRAKLRVKSRGANILRLRDALHPEDATTPVKRLYYVAQLAVTGDSKPDDVARELIPALQDLREIFTKPEQLERLDEIRNQARAGDFYRVMRLLKTFIPYEDKLFMIARAKSARQATAVDTKAH